MIKAELILDLVLPFPVIDPKDMCTLDISWSDLEHVEQSREFFTWLDTSVNS